MEIPLSYWLVEEGFCFPLVVDMNGEFLDTCLARFSLAKPILTPTLSMNSILSSSFLILAQSFCILIEHYHSIFERGFTSITFPSL